MKKELGAGIERIEQELGELLIVFLAPDVLTDRR